MGRTGAAQPFVTHSIKLSAQAPLPIATEHVCPAAMRFLVLVIQIAFMNCMAHLRLRGVCGVAIAASASLLAGCGVKPSSSAPAPAAKVSAVAREDELNTVELSPDAEKRLGVTTTLLESRKLPRVRRFGAEIALPPG